MAIFNQENIAVSFFSEIKIYTKNIEIVNITYVDHCSIDDVTSAKIRMNISCDFMNHAPIRQKVALNNHSLSI